MRMLQQKLAPLYDAQTSTSGGGSLELEGATAAKFSSLVDQYFGGQFDVTYPLLTTNNENHLNLDFNIEN